MDELLKVLLTRYLIQSLSGLTGLFVVHAVRMLVRRALTLNFTRWPSELFTDDVELSLDGAEFSYRLYCRLSFDCLITDIIRPPWMNFFKWVSNCGNFIFRSCSSRAVLTTAFVLKTIGAVCGRRFFSDFFCCMLVPFCCSFCCNFANYFVRQKFSRRKI